MITDRFFLRPVAAALLGIGILAGTAAAQQAPNALPAAASQRAPIWLDGAGRPTDAALILVDFLRRADEHGLPAAKYRGDQLASRLRGGGGGSSLEADLTAAFIAYARDVSSGVLTPADVDSDLHIEARRPDAASLLAGAAKASNIAAYLDGLAPQDPLYRRLVERYRSFRSVAGADIWGPRVPSGPTLRLGDRGSRVAAARARLTAMGDLDPNAYLLGRAADGTRVAAAGATSDATVGGFDPSFFDAEMEAALRRFQARHGLNQDGLVGPATLAQLNVSPRERAEQIAVNLERLRWLNGRLGERHILVNLAGFEMWVVEDRRPVFASRVIVGQSDSWETPEFIETMTHMIVNPRWNVPMSIARQEILPKLKQDPSYLARQGMRLVGSDRSAEQIDWSRVTPDTFPGRITQLPGDGNALGDVKFMFPNPHAVYLHDTPAKHLFDRDIRDFSHGCIRVERARELAAYLLDDQRRNPASYFDSIVADGREHRITLENPLPVILAYRTAWIDENGVEQFRGDIYGRDRTVASALKSAGVRILN